VVRTRAWPKRKRSALVLEETGPHGLVEGVQHVVFASVDKG